MALLGKCLASSSTQESSQTVFSPLSFSLKDWRLAEAWQRAVLPSIFPFPFSWEMPRTEPTCLFTLSSECRFAFLR